MAITASVKKIRPDHICQVQLCTSSLVLFFRRRPGSHCAKPAWMWSGWYGQVLAKHTGSGSKPVCKNNQAWFWQNASGPLQFLAFKFSSLLPQTAQIILCKTSLGLILFWLSGFGQTDLVRKQASVPEPSGPHLANNASKPSQIRCELDLACFLGYIVHSSNDVGGWLLLVVVVQICWSILPSIKTMLHVSRSKSCSSMPPCFAFLFLWHLSCSF